MRKIIIILILLSMFSVIGCNNEQKSPKGRIDWSKIKKSDEQIIKDLKDELEECKDMFNEEYELLLEHRKALKDIKEENEEIEDMLDEFEHDYLTKRNAIDEIYWHTFEIEDILEKLEIK